jgi:subtilisin family serine protease
MARYLISNRLAGRTDRKASRDSLNTVAASLSAFADVEPREEREAPPAEPHEVRRTLYIDTDPKELQERAKDWSPDVMVEPALPRYLSYSSLGSLVSALAPQTTQAVPAGVARTLRVTVRGAGKWLPDALGLLVLASAIDPGVRPGTRVQSTSDGNGTLAFQYNPKLWSPVLLILEPWQGYWGWWQASPQDGTTFDLPALPKSGPLGWWHQLVGLAQDAPGRGKGVRIGVVDSGVGPHPYLPAVNSLGAFTGGNFDPGGGADVQVHGTHVAGIIGARPADGSGDYRGIADGADLLAVRVFPATGSADQGDTALAIDLLASQGADLINMSLGGPQYSEIENDAIVAAQERGTMCLAAAGNDFGGPVAFPAAYPQSVAVSAVGLLGASPDGTTAAHTMPSQADRYTAGGLFFPDFSNIGPKVACAAPGVGIISTVPRRPAVNAPYAALSGTSMATPVACASLATWLARDQTYLSSARGTERVARAAAILAATLVPVGLNPIYVGSGVCRASPM